MNIGRVAAGLALLLAPSGVGAQINRRVPRSATIAGVVYRARVYVVTDSALMVDGAGPPVRRPLARLRTAVTVTNSTRRTITLRLWESCFLTALRLWPVGAPLGRPAAWDEERWRVEYTRTTGIIIECDLGGRARDWRLAPGASVAIVSAASGEWVREVLGDSLRAGRYRAVVRVRPHTVLAAAEPGRIPAPTVALDAGVVVLPPTPVGPGVHK